jgi:osmotically-inducible protein OsmY
MQVDLAYAAVPRFQAPAIAAPQLQADLSGMLARSTGAIANPAGVQVFTAGGTVTLRGTVRDVEEARLVEGMVRMTPGVQAVQNELQFPR